MKTKILMTVSFVATMAVTAPALADSSVLCSVRQGLKNGSVGAAYTPGVDVHGKPVVSADLAPAPMAAPKSMTIPLTMDMAQRFNSVLPAGAKMEAQVGTVDIMQDGRVMINGKDVSGAADAVCTTMAKQKAAALKTNDAPKARKKNAAPKVEAAVESAPVAEAAATPAPALAPEPVPAAPAPQVLDAAPPAMPAPAPEAAAPVAPQPTPMATEPAPVVPTPVAPAPAAGAAPTPPASGAIVSPTEGGNVPRPPLDPLTGAPSPAPAPAPAAGGTLSGGSQ